MRKVSRNLTLWLDDRCSVVGGSIKHVGQRMADGDSSTNNMNNARRRHVWSFDFQVFAWRGSFASSCG